MPYAKLTINNDVLLDGDLGDWLRRHINEFKDHLNLHNTEEPWLAAAYGTLAKYALANHDIVITIVAASPQRWSMDIG